jgi:hypothetical protein
LKEAAMRLLHRSVMAVLVVAAVAGCTPDDFPFEPPPYQVELPPPPPEYDVAHTFTYVPHEDTPEITRIVVRGEFNDWGGDSLAMVLHDGVWSVTVALEPGETYWYKYVFNNDQWADDMCASATWGNPPGGQIDPNLAECRGGGDARIMVDPEGLAAHTFRYVPREGGPDIDRVVVRGSFEDRSDPPLPNWDGNALAMRWSGSAWWVTVGLESGDYKYKYVFNDGQWANNMCASEEWGNPAGGPIDPDVEECDGEDAKLTIF